MQVFCLILIFCLSQTHGNWDSEKRTFPPAFRFGVTTSAYQVEGAWNEDGKGESILDNFYHSKRGVTADGETGDETSDSYHLVDRDVEMMREMGVDFYRFSISWSRILPTGFPNVINEKAFQYYEKLLDELYKYNIETMVTIYHYDLPQPIQDLGGWTNPLIVQWFQNYASVVFQRLSKKVKYWISINNPAICFKMYSGRMPPAILSQGIGDYICAKNMLLAHATVYRLYDEEYKQKGVKGLLGISLAINWADPLDFNTTQHEEAAELYRSFSFGMFMNPIWGKKGDLPQLVKKVVAKRSKEQGFPTSRLPEFSPDEIELIKNSSDFLGMNHYTTHFVRFPNRKLASNESSINPYVDIDVELSHGKGWTRSKSPWLTAAPYGLYKACLYLNEHYDHPPIIITEHGWSTNVGIKDDSRVNNMREYMKAVLVSLEDGTDLRGMAFWSLMDNFQWEAGFTERFGLYEVDFNDSKKKRTPRYSALFLRYVIDTRKLDEQWKPDTLSLDITRRRLLQREKRQEEL